MSSPAEFVYLAADSPLVSWRDRPLRFIAAPFMQQRPELRKGEGASFGTFRLRDGDKTGWLVIPNPAALGAAAKKTFVDELVSANPGLDEAALERLELERLCWEYAEARRLKERAEESRRLASLPQQTGPPQVQPPVRLAMQPSEVYQGEWYQLAGKPPGETVRIISARNADGEWQAYTPEHQVIKVGLDKLVHRISQTGQCICTYANENDVCRCAAKFSINEEDRALAADELQRRHNVTKRRGQKRARAQ